MEEEMLERVVERFADDLRKELNRKVEDVVKFKEELDRKMEEFEEYLKETAKIAMPVNLLEILARDGIVKVWEFDEKHQFDISVMKDGFSLDMCPYNDYGGIRLHPGKYRVILIVEKLK
jgi:adenylate cyclase